MTSKYTVEIRPADKLVIIYLVVGSIFIGTIVISVGDSITEDTENLLKSICLAAQVASLSIVTLHEILYTYFGDKAQLRLINEKQLPV